LFNIHLIFNKIINSTIIQGPSKKTEAKAKAKIVEDKTFGLKNKNKSAKVNNKRTQMTYY
jgi:hypothetical protein